MMAHSDARVGEYEANAESDDDAWLASLGPLLLRDEYPDQMAERSCSCEPEAVCGAHRLLARYEALYAELRKVNADRRQLRAEIRSLKEASRG